MRLYEIADAYRSAMAEVEDAEGEVTDALAERLGAIEADLADKVDQCLALRAEAVAVAVAARAEATRLTARARASEGRADALTAYVLRELTTMGVRRVQGGRFAASVVGGRSRVVVDDAAALPPELVRVRVEPDKVALGAALAAGPVPGAHLELGPPSLRVR